MEIDENANLADKDLFSMAEEDRFTFYNRQSTKPNFVKYYQKLCRVKNLEVLVPKEHSGKLCMDIQNDEKMWKGC
jgi:hypothetical protein